MSVKFSSVLTGAVIALAAMGAALAFGAHRWNKGTQSLRDQIRAARLPIEPLTFRVAELEGLPAPVQRYFHRVLRDGQPMISGARAKHDGTFNMGESDDGWKKFTSDQLVVTRRPGFDWDGRVYMMPGVAVRVHDAYAAGKGFLHASVFGLFTLAVLRDSEDVSRGELMRFFAEAAWYPTALLPSQGVAWEPVDANSACATLTDGLIQLRMLFTFSEDGLIESIGVDARGRTVGSRVIPTPWKGRFWNYQEWYGMVVPLDGEVSWIIDGVTRPYWRGRITELEYEFAR